MAESPNSLQALDLSLAETLPTAEEPTAFNEAPKTMKEANGDSANESVVPLGNEGPNTLGEAFADTARAGFHAVDAAGRGLIDTATQGLLNPVFGTDIPEFPKPTLVAEPKYAINQIAKAIGAYGVGLLPALAGMRAAGVASSVVSSARGQAAASAAGVGLTAPAHDEGLANLAEKYEFLRGPIIDALAHREGETFWEGKLKAVTEDAFGSALGVAAFKVLAHGVRLSKGLIKPGTKEAVAADADIAETISTINEAAESGTIQVEKYPHLLSPEEKPLHLSNPKLTPDTQLSGFKQVNVNELRIIDSMHPDEVNLSKVQAIRDAIRAGKGKDFPPIELEHSDKGGYNVVDGRHRLIAAQQEGYTSITANIDKNTEKAAVKRVQKLDEQAGGAGELSKLAAQTEKARQVFNLDETQYNAFITNLTDKIKAMRSDPNIQVENLFTESLPEGAFNYGKMANRADVHFALEAMADIIQPNLKGIRKDYMSLREMAKTAQLLGTKPDVMLANLRSWGVTADRMPATLIAAKTWMQSLSSDIYRDARSIAIMGSGGDSARIEMARKITILADIEGMAKSLQTAAARVMNAGKVRTKPAYSGKELLQMMDEMGGADKLTKLAEKLALTNGDPAAIGKLLRVSWARKIVDTHNELWINALLSGISTHVVNMSTASFNTFIKPGHIALGGLMRGDAESVAAGIGTWKAMGSNFRDSMTMARRAFDMERPLLSVTDKQLEIDSTVSAANYNLNPETWLGQGVNWIGKAARIPSRLLGAEDEFFKQLAYRSKLQYQATSESLKLVRSDQLDPKKMVTTDIDGKAVTMSEVDLSIYRKFQEGFEYEILPEFAGKRAVKGEELLSKQVQAADEGIKQFANEATFTQSLKTPTWFGNRSLSETIYQAANSHPMLRGTVLPFVKVPANLMREAASYTPGIGQLRKQFWSDMQAGGERASEAIGKLSTGSLLMGGAVMLAVDGSITGGMPTDPDIRARMLEKGWQPYSFVFGTEDGKKTYVPFARFDPYGLLFGIVGDVAQTFQHVDESSRHNLAASATMAVANMLNSRSYLKGLVDTLDVVSGGQGQDGINKMMRIANSKAGSYMPNLVRTFQPDTEIKEVRSMLDAIMAKTPGFSTLVPAKRGYFGDKVMSPVGWPWHAILPSKPGQESSDPALLELARLSDGPAQAHFSGPDKKVGTLDLYQYKNLQGETAYEVTLRHLNETDFHERMNALVTSPAYLAGNDGDGYYPGSKQVEIKRLESRYHKVALDRTMREFQEQAPQIGFDLRQMYLDDRKNVRQSKTNRETTDIDRLLELNEQ